MMRTELRVNLGRREYNAPSQMNILGQLSREWAIRLITGKSNWQDDESMGDV
jgi:hypothetical protein